MAQIGFITSVESVIAQNGGDSVEKEAHFLEWRITAKYSEIGYSNYIFKNLSQSLALCIENTTHYFEYVIAFVTNHIAQFLLIHSPRLIFIFI